MKVERQTLYLGDAPERAGQNAQAGPGRSRKSVDASGLTARFDPIAAKKAQAQKKALKVVGDAFDGDRRLDADLEDRRAKVRKLTEENGVSRKAILQLEEQRKELRGQYGVEEDSQEEQDLQLLAKAKDAGRAGSGIRLTKEESERVQEIRDAGLTEYQKRSMELKDFEDPYRDAIEKNEQEISAENAVIRGVGLERLKHHTMVDAQKNADSILEAAGREIVGMLVEQGREHVEEELEETVAEAKEKAEEKKEQEEKIEKAKEKKHEREELTQEIIESTQELTMQAVGGKTVKQEIQEIMNKMKLVEEDLKGAAVDQTI